jgi:hypothetical protein
MTPRAILNNYEAGNVGQFLDDLRGKGIECPAAYAGQLIAAIRRYHGDNAKIVELLPEWCGFMRGVYSCGPVALIRSYSLLDAIQPEPPPADPPK